MHPIALLVSSIVFALVMTIPTPIGVAAAPPEPVASSRDFSAGEVCAFPVRVEYTGKQKHIDVPGGSAIVTGPRVHATVTNLDTGRQVSWSLTGAIHLSPLSADTTEVVFTGRNLLFFHSTKEWLLLRGRFRVVIDATGAVVEPLSGNGQQTPVCPLLA